MSSRHEANQTPGTRPTVRPALGAAVLALALASLRERGSRTVGVDRFDYSSAIADSWKQQTLLNIVKIRYVDLPVFVDVSSVVAGYSLQTGVTVGGVVSSERAVRATTDRSAARPCTPTDRPITYVPMTGEKFLRGMITPIDPKNIFFMLQAGYPADFILGLTVESLNGVRNRSAGGIIRRQIRNSFACNSCCGTCRPRPASACVSRRTRPRLDGGAVLQRDDLPADMMEKSAEIAVAQVAGDQQKFVLTYSPMRGADNELAVNSRSLLQILQAFGSHVGGSGAGPAGEGRDAGLRARGEDPMEVGASAAARPDPKGARRVHTGELVLVETATG